MKAKLTADNLGVILSATVREILGQMQSQVGDKLAEVAQMAYNKAHELASSKLSTTRQRYIDSLKLERQAMNKFVLTLDADAAHIEEGYDSFAMKPGLLRSPKAKISNKGFKYIRIPFDHKQAAAAPTHPMHNRQIELTTKRENRMPNELKTGRTSYGNMEADLKHAAMKSGLHKIVKGPDGKPVLGKVGHIAANPHHTGMIIKTDHEGFKANVDLKGRQLDKNVLGATKYQYQVGKTVRSVWLTFRTASDNPAAKSKWIHPGYEGAKIFPIIEQWADGQIAKIVQDLKL